MHRCTDFVRVGEVYDAKEISKVVNVAFLSDAFFKKSDYIYRLDFEGETATKMMTEQSEHACFIVIERTNETQDKVIIAALWTHWECKSDSSSTVEEPTGHVSMVSVLPEHSNQGVGKKLIRAAELHCEVKLKAALPQMNSFTMKVPIVSGRTVPLLAWYRKQGYEYKEDAPFPTPEIVAPGHTVTLLVLWKRIHCIN